MLGKFVCLNGQFIKSEDAKINLDNIEFSYGFGVYENVSLRNGRVYFLIDHLERLLHSAKVIELGHSFTVKTMAQWVNWTIAKNKIQSANIKILLIGGAEPRLYIMLLAPRYPDKKIYREGVKVVPYIYERFLPQAKTLNMLPSYLAFIVAKEQGACDALFVDNHGHAVEGARSNFFAIKNKTLFTAPVKRVLDGVTRRTVIQCAKKNGYKIIEKNIKLREIFKYDGAFLTNTSTKIVPIRQIDNKKFEIVCEEIKNLIRLYGEYIKKSD